MYVLKLVQVLFLIMPLILRVSAIFVAYTRKYAQVRDNIFHVETLDFEIEHQHAGIPTIGGLVC